MSFYLIYRFVFLNFINSFSYVRVKIIYVLKLFVFWKHFVNCHAIRICSYYFCCCSCYYYYLFISLTFFFLFLFLFIHWSLGPRPNSSPSWARASLSRQPIFKPIYGLFFGPPSFKFAWPFLSLNSMYSGCFLQHQLATWQDM